MSLRACTLAAVSLVLTPGVDLAAQAVNGDAAAQVQLFAGDSVRIDRSLVGRVLSIEGPRMTVVSRGVPRCRAGEMHGDAPLCDPAPLIRREMDLADVTIERRMQKDHLTARTLVGGLIGAAAFGVAGYYIGPEFGFGKVDGCLEVSDTVLCSNPIERSELARRQKTADQRKGVLFFGVIGGSFVAIMARKLSVGWIEIQPTIPVSSTEPWGLSFEIPTAR